MTFIRFCIGLLACVLCLASGIGVEHLGEQHSLPPVLFAFGIGAMGSLVLWR